jgi:uncharacterized protein (DUF924 family)
VVGADREVSKDKRSFFYMPYMHSESLDVHKEAENLFKEYGGDLLKYEETHRNIIEKFGRYPHRNKILKRESTKEEISFLKEHSGF